MSRAPLGGEVANTSVQVRLHPRRRDDVGNVPVSLPTERWPGHKLCLLICDCWDHHWCPSASARVAELAPAINATAQAMREAGALILHAPANCMAFYDSTPQRRAATSAPVESPPVPLVSTQRFGTTWCWPEPAEGPLPIDDADGGCDCVTASAIDTQVWSHEHAAIELHIDDAITDVATEVYNVLVQHGIQCVLMCGVHLNLCVLGRGYGVRQLLRLGFEVRLLRDLTDTMFSGKGAAPFVDHFAGTHLVIEHVEARLCPSVLSSDLTGTEPFRFRDAPAATSIQAAQVRAIAEPQEPTAAAVTPSCWAPSQADLMRPVDACLVARCVRLVDTASAGACGAGASVLELGCGAGLEMKRLLELRTACVATVLDSTSITQAEVAQTRATLLDLASLSGVTAVEHTLPAPLPFASGRRHLQNQNLH